LPQGSAQNIWNGMTLDDWKWMAEELNKLGELGKKSGVTVGYHNHNPEFRVLDGVVAYDELLRRTDPTLVTMELDIAWVVVAGHDPVKYLTEHADRISLLHVKDVKKDVKTIVEQPMTTTTEVGSGQVDWQRLFAACSPRFLDRYYYEQEQWDGPVLEAAKKSFDYLSRMKV
jgi:sugar phosphate isomerase/epimerase